MDEQTHPSPSLKMESPSVVLWNVSESYVKIDHGLRFTFSKSPAVAAFYLMEGKVGKSFDGSLSWHSYESTLATRTYWAQLASTRPGRATGNHCDHGETLGTRISATQYLFSDQALCALWQKSGRIGAG